MIEKIFEALFPERCLGCNKWDKYLCDECWRKLPFLRQQRCPYCDKPSPGGITHQPLCTHLPDGAPRQLHLDGALAALEYNDLARKLVSQFKYYPQVENLKSEIAKIFRRYFTPEEEYFPHDTVITAVPLHWLRHNERGFNQAEVIAKILANLWQLETNFDLLKRKKNTKQQVGLKRSDRFRNIRGAFALSDTLNPQYLPLNIILVDDVWTTGYTLKECAKVLKRNSAQKVWAVTLARD